MPFWPRKMRTGLYNPVPIKKDTDMRVIITEHARKRLKDMRQEKITAQDIIGAATGMPLVQEDVQIRDAFAGKTSPLNEVYYVGELLFRPAYRNSGLGRKLLDQLEKYIRSLGPYRRLTCATVERPDKHPLRPPDYIPITRFLVRTGFAGLFGVTTSFMWRETDGVKRDHPMQFWIKELT